jgi:glycosyltransferase involved in cell wall biosynthesis
MSHDAHRAAPHKARVTPRISVLLPCRNVAAFLHSCITSLETQTLRDFEVIAVNDSSIDETPHILSIWEQQDPRVRVIATDSTGLVNALNVGLQEARTEFIARMDADDIARPQRFEKQLRAFHNDPELVACGTHVHYFPREIVRAGALRYEAWLNSLIEPQHIERDIFIECPLAHPTLMVRTEVLRAVGGYRDRGWPEDYDLILRLYSRHARMRNLPDVLLDWRERPDRASRNEARYTEEAFRRCKVFYLAATVLGDESCVIIWGAGPVGKAFAREFIEQGVQVRAFVDIDERKIGQTIHGAPVISPPELPLKRSGAFIVSAVSGPEARAEIRSALRGMGMVEGTDFLALA